MPPPPSPHCTGCVERRRRRRREPTGKEHDSVSGNGGNEGGSGAASWHYQGPGLQDASRGLMQFRVAAPSQLRIQNKAPKKKKRKKKPSVQHVVILNAAPVRNRHLPPRGARTVRPTRRRGKDGGCLACYDEERQTPLRAASSVATPPNVSTGNNAKQGSCQWCIRILATPPVLSYNSDRRVGSMCTRVRVAASFFLRHRLISPPPSGPGEWVPHTVCITVPLPLRRQCRRTRKLLPVQALRLTSHARRLQSPPSPRTGASCCHISLVVLLSLPTHGTDQ